MIGTFGSKYKYAICFVGGGEFLVVDNTCILKKIHIMSAFPTPVSQDCGPCQYLCAGTLLPQTAMGAVAIHGLNSHVQKGNYHFSVNL